MKGKHILSQSSLRDEYNLPVEKKETEREIRSRDLLMGTAEQDLKALDIYSVLYLNTDVEEAIVKEMIAYACVIAEKSESLFPVSFSHMNGKKVLIIRRNFNNPKEVEELLSVSYAAYLSSDA